MTNDGRSQSLVTSRESHVPVLFHEAIRSLDLHPGDFAVDGTVDGGGHAAGIIEGIGSAGKLLGVDLDPAMVTKTTQAFAGLPNVKIIRGNYADLPEILRREDLPKANALFLDLGFSSGQLAGSGKGMSFSADEPLAMTYDPDAMPVSEFLKTLAVPELARIIREFGGERFALRIAKAIVEREKRRPIRTTGELREAIVGAVPRNYERGRIDPATRTFQALRIHANRELENLERAMKALPEILAPGGRAVVITFHSLEDRIVKNAFRNAAKAGTMTILTKKPIVPSAEEIAENPRSRSAKLRAVKLVPST